MLVSIGQRSTESVMPARTPQQVHEFFLKAVLANDLEGVMALYDTDAVLVSGGQPVRGHEAIKKVITAQLAMNPRDGSLEVISCIERDGLALMRSKWRFIGDDPDGNPFDVTGSGTEVAHRKTDGAWVYLIDSPRGGDPLAGGA
jgi:uncharacterized protein (TIGR02246 family)